MVRVFSSAAPPGLGIVVVATGISVVTAGPKHDILVKTNHSTGHRKRSVWVKLKKKVFQKNATLPTLTDN